MSVAKQSAGRRALQHPPRRTFMWINLAIYLLSIAVIGASLGYLAHRPALRWRIDSTKTRAYSLSDQTRQILEGLQGDWRIDVVCVESMIPRDTLRQVDEVLARYNEASDRIVVDRIDPVNPESLVRYQTLVERLKRLYGQETDMYQSGITTGRDTLNEVLQIAASHASQLQTRLPMLSTDHQLYSQFVQTLRNLILMVNSGEGIVPVVDKSMQVDDDSLVPDYEAARDTLVATLSEMGESLQRIADFYEGSIAARLGLAVELRNLIARDRVAIIEASERCLRAADPLRHLPPLELSRISRELQQGEAAIVTGNGRATVIPAWQLFPQSQTVTDGGISFDQRFRGEQVLSSAIVSLTVPSMPQVVFVHAQSESMLMRRQDGTDLFGVATVLRSALFDVREWSVVNEPSRPSLEIARPVVWIICPPPFRTRLSRSAFDMSLEERLLIEECASLLMDGESVMINFYPSTLHKYRTPDPWQEVVSAFGLRPDTSRMILEEVIDVDGSSSKQSGITVRSYPQEHEISRALEGQTMLTSMPVPLDIAGTLPDRVSRSVLVEITPSSSRWLEEDWTQGAARLDEPTPEQRFDNPMSVAAAAWRPHPSGRGTQRVIAVGSMEWMYSGIADKVLSIGGDRVALIYPGNIEFLQASVAWLSGLDDLIAQSPASRQVSRLQNLDDSSQKLWRWITLCFVPGSVLLLGCGVWVVRRS